jgi:hypothetical protein
MNLKLTLNFDRLFKVDHMVADPNPRQLPPKKRLILLFQKKELSLFKRGR